MSRVQIHAVTDLELTSEPGNMSGECLRYRTLTVRVRSYVYRPIHIDDNEIPSQKVSTGVQVDTIGSDVGFEGKHSNSADSLNISDIVADKNGIN